MRFVEVTWLDTASQSESGWKETKELRELMPMVGKFRGWLVHETEHYIVFATHKIGEGDDLAWDGDVCIPKGCITSLRDVDEHGPDTGQSVVFPQRGNKPDSPARKGKVVAARKRRGNRVG